MNLPNKLTMLRILLIPVFMVVLYWDFPGATWVAVAISSSPASPICWTGKSPESTI